MTISGEKIEGGYILLARRFSESELMSKPPLWIKLFVWMLLKANKTDGYKGLKIGQFRTNINEMRAAMTYYAGASPRTPSIKQIRVIYESLTKGTTEGTAKGLTNGRAKGTDNNAIIKITKVRGGMLISVLNYEKYQEPKNYERQDKKQPKKHTKGRAKGHTKGRAKSSRKVKQGHIL
uniref:Replication protein n=1 Tax=uncultured marine virus TaxID=186617 RepID=A0A0F7L4V2_9VIRU|nr:replication protein [uncultured marine virus]